MLSKTYQNSFKKLAKHLGNANEVRRSGRAVQPALESLEGRVVMDGSPFDPTFGVNGTVLGQLDTGNGPALSDASAVAVQLNNNTIVVGSVARPQSLNVAPQLSNSITYPTLAARRYLPNGTLDTTFGTNGQSDVPAPTGYGALIGAPHNVIVEPNGDIVFAATYEILNQPPLTVFPGGNVPNESVVVRLTSNGQLDTTFGTNGQAVTAVDARLDAVGMQSDGRIVAAGSSGGPLAGGISPEVVRLTTAGTLDTSFNTSGTLVLPLPGPRTAAQSGSLVAVQVALNGQIYVAGISSISGGASQDTQNAIVARINGDGTLDSSYAVGGVASLLGTTRGAVNVADMALQNGGAVVLVGVANSSSFLVRVKPDGTPNDLVSPPLNPTSPQLNVTYNSVVVQSDGKIIVGGSTLDPNIISLLPYQNYSGLVDRYLPTGAFDPQFGQSGRVQAQVTPTSIPNVTPAFIMQPVNSVATTLLGNIVAVGTASIVSGASGSGRFSLAGTQAVVSKFLGGPLRRSTPGDYTSDGQSDVAAELTAFGAFAIRKSDGTGDLIQPFGPTGAGQTIPAPGDYDGDGRTDIAAYLPAFGALVYRPSSGGADVATPFGFAGPGGSIPAPGDYDGDGKTDVAAYLPALGILAYRPSLGGADVLTQFGFAGTNGSIPAPGDYDGDRKTDLAVYLPSLGVLAHRPSSGGTDVLTQFGLAGSGGSIPTPGDYDGDGKTDLAVFLPSLGIYAYRPSSGGVDVLEQFGLSGSGGSIPAPGDYNGDGKTDIAVYLPSLGVFAYRPSGGGPDVLEPFGAAGTGQTVPASSISDAQPSTRSSPSMSAQSVAVNIPLTDNLTSPISISSIKRKSRSGVFDRSVIQKSDPLSEFRTSSVGRS